MQLGGSTFLEGQKPLHLMGGVQSKPMGWSTFTLAQWAAIAGPQNSQPPLFPHPQDTTKVFSPTARPSGSLSLAVVPPLLRFQIPTPSGLYFLGPAIAMAAEGPRTRAGTRPHPTNAERRTGGRRQREADLACRPRPPGATLNKLQVPRFPPPLRAPPTDPCTHCPHLRDHPPRVPSRSPRPLPWADGSRRPGEGCGAFVLTFPGRCNAHAH